VPTTWEIAASRLGEKINAEYLDEKLDRLIKSSRALWNHYINLTIARDRIVTARVVDQEKLDAINLVMQTRDAELYALESQIAATDRQILKLPPETDRVIVQSSIWATAKRRRLRR
jgi:hypothetical protein